MTNSSFLVSLLGSMPRSKKLLTAKRKLNKGNIDLKTYNEILDKETKYVVELQENNRNKNMGLSMVGIPYDIREKAELYGNVSYLWEESRNLNGMLKIKPRIRAYKISIRD